VARVREVVPDRGGENDVEYLWGLRGTVRAGVEFVLEGIERDGRGGRDGDPVVPREPVLQARRAARAGVSVDAVIRRYMVGQALLWEYILEEADRMILADGGRRLRGVLHAQSALADRLVMDVAREHEDELRRARCSREHRLREQINALLAGETAAASDILASGLDYDLRAEHVGVIARGQGAVRAVRQLACMLDRRVLSITHGEDVVWGWLGGTRRLRMLALERGAKQLPQDVCMAVGEPARGLEGFRSTHQQAQAALLVALRTPRRIARYGEVALLAGALKDPLLAATLIKVYIAPLQDARDRGVVLLRTLHAYLAAECRVSSTAAALGVARNTIEKRLRTIEERLEHSLHPIPPELQVALALAPQETRLNTQNH
jgi:PucR C-terminal helix-turn-helix domain/GGDEF-like domain